MDTIEIFAQIIGFIAMAFAILSYQRKTGKGALIFQLICGLLFSIHLFMLHAISGALLNMVAFIRAILFLYKDKLKSDNNIWLAGFTVVYIVFYIMSFKVFNMEPSAKNLIVEVLPVIGMIASTLGLRSHDAKKLRKFGLISSPTWIIYGIFNGSVGGVVSEVISLCSIIIGIIRFDIKKIEQVKNNSVTI